MFRQIRGRSVTFAVTEDRVFSLYLRTSTTQCERALEAAQAYAERNAGDSPTSLFSATRNMERTSKHSVGLWHYTGRII